MRKLMFKLIGLIVLTGAVALGWLWMDYKAYLNTPMPIAEEGMTYTLEPGSNLTRVVYTLAKEGLVQKPRYLLLFARLHGEANRIKAGEYFIEAGATPKIFIEKLFSGEVKQYALTIVEGWNFRQLMDAVNGNEVLKHNLQDMDAAKIMGKLGHPELHPEGRFLPDTYHFPRGLSDVEFLKRAFDAMQHLLQTEWQKREVGLPLKTPYEALTLASIVEKETGLASERRAIAGVFVRRLEKRIRLQTDPTVIYGMGEDYNGNIRRRDLKRDTPYNTYRRRGLPPTPIAMPGREAIHATLHPDNSDNLYFVSRGDGSHHFSATLEEHNKAVIKYQLKGRKRSFSSYKTDNQ